MLAELAGRRRLLAVTYRRYLDAERAWTMLIRETRSWFPEESRPSRASIGNPGSRVRRAYERRERAMLQLYAARVKLEEAKRRLAAAARKGPSGRILIGRVIEAY